MQSISIRHLDSRDVSLRKAIPRIASKVPPVDWVDGWNCIWYVGHNLIEAAKCTYCTQTNFVSAAVRYIYISKNSSLASYCETMLGSGLTCWYQVDEWGICSLGKWMSCWLPCRKVVARSALCQFYSRMSLQESGHRRHQTSIWTEYELASLTADE
jgi:hypothetical protein